MNAKEELEAVMRGFNRKGPCGCHWHSIRHGDKCPEHGTVGEPLPTVEDWQFKAARYDAMRAALEASVKDISEADRLAEWLEQQKMHPHAVNVVDGIRCKLAAALVRAEAALKGDG